MHLEQYNEADFSELVKQKDLTNVEWGVRKGNGLFEVHGLDEIIEAPDKTDDAASISGFNAPSLSARQFARFAALHGYDDAIESILAGLKSTNIGLYAEIKGDVVGAKEFHLAKVLAVISNSDVGTAIPDNVDVSSSVVTERWSEAIKW